MNFLKKMFNSTNTRLICSEFLFLTFTALPALADNCSVSDRVPLPGCVTAEYIQGGNLITNNCRHRVTLKVDIANGRDQRVDVGANGGTTLVKASGRYKLSCCPKYNHCN